MNKKGELSMQLILILIAAFTLLVLFLILSPTGKKLIAAITNINLW